MTSALVGALIEGFVAILLLITIGYCFVLNRRLTRLRADEHALRMVVGELIQATDSAERAIGGLRSTVNDSEKLLTTRLRQAERFSSDLDFKIDAGERVLKRLAAISDAARRPSSVRTDDIFSDQAKKGRVA